jgi:hypothetical protein
MAIIKPNVVKTGNQRSAPYNQYFTTEFAVFKSTVPFSASKSAPAIKKRSFLIRIQKYCFLSLFIAVVAA